MTRLWLGVLARKLLWVRKSQARRPVRRPCARLRLDALEDRTVTSTLTIEPPGLLPATPEAYHAFESTSGQSAAAVNGAASATGLGGPALERLLEDVQKLDALTSDSPSAGPTIAFPPSSRLDLAHSLDS